jgi:hypothetical protein
MANDAICHAILTKVLPYSLNFSARLPVLEEEERTDTMFEWDFSSNAERLVAFLLVCAIVVTALA